MRLLNGWVLAIALVCLVSATSAQIVEWNKESITLLPGKVADGVTWSNGLSLTDRGLKAEELPQNQIHNFWVQTHVFPIGMSWRPPSSATFTVSVDGNVTDAEWSFATTEVALRFSPDKVNWSTWYAFTQDTTTKKFQLKLWQPRVASARYQELEREWWKTKPIWSSDENEFCEWLVKREPDFFVKEKPFIGYVQLRLDRYDARAEQYISGLTVEYSTAVGGLMSPQPKGVRNDVGRRWFFVGPGYPK
jgi:hypothetical protein